MKPHLAPDGVAFLNTTWSDEALRTASLAFPHAYRLMNCALTSNAPIVPDRERSRQALERFRIEGRPLLDLRDGEQRKLFDRLALQFDVSGAPPSHFFETRPAILARTAALGTITDDNMLTEWKQVR